MLRQLALYTRLTSGTLVMKETSWDRNGMEWIESRRRASTDPVHAAAACQQKHSVSHRLHSLVCDMLIVSVLFFLTLQ
jgi:hypothetical protein